MAGGLLIGLFGRRVADREMATGTILALATALGVLFASLASANAGTTTSVLFGNLLAISRDQLLVFGAFTAFVVLTLAVLARPLVFASVDPDVAEARGVPVRALGLAFVVLLALTITMAVQVVGTLLLFALVVTPAATALRLTARPVRVAALAVAMALGSVWGGLVLSAMVDLPPSFFIVSLAVLAWVAVLVATGRRSAADARSWTPTTPTDLRVRERDLTPDGVDHSVRGCFCGDRPRAGCPHGRHAARRPGGRGLLHRADRGFPQPRGAGDDRGPPAGQPAPHPPGLSSTRSARFGPTHSPSPQRSHRPPPPRRARPPLVTQRNHLGVPRTAPSRRWCTIGPVTAALSLAPADPLSVPQTPGPRSAAAAPSGRRSSSTPPSGSSPAAARAASAWTSWSARPASAR